MMGHFAGAARGRTVAVALCAALLAAAPAVAQTAPAPAKSRSVQVTTRAPEPNKWVLVTSSPARRLFKCRPDVCHDAEAVSFVFQKGSLVAPNPKSLEKLANVDLPKNMRAIAAAQSVLTGGAENIETLTSTTTTLKNFPSVLNVTKFSRGPDSVYVAIAIIFAGPVIIRVESKSSNHDLAQISLNQFVEAMEIAEAPTPPPTAPQPARPNPNLPKTQNL
jgi:hypothetical protein